MYCDAQPTSTSLSLRRRKLLIVSAISWGIWTICNIFNLSTRPLGHWKFPGAYPGLESWPAPVALIYFVSYFASWVVWVVSLFRVMAFEKELKKEPKFLASLTDELYQQTRLRAFASAFLCVLTAQIAIGLASYWLPITGIVAAGITIFIGVESFLWSFLLLDRE